MSSSRKVFGHRERQIGGLAPHQRRLVRGRDHHDRARQALLAEVVLQEFLDLAAAFADQPDDADRGIDVAREHRQQHRFADAGACENAHALAAAAGEERVHRAHAEIERGADALARMRRRRRIAEWHRRRALRQWPLAVDRLAQRVDDAAEPGRRRTHLIGGIGDDGLAAAAHPVQAGERHHDSVVAGEADHLAGNGTVRAGLDHEPRTDRHRVNGSGHFDHQAANADHAAIDVDAVDVADLFGKSLHQGRAFNKRTFIR